MPNLSFEVSGLVDDEDVNPADVAEVLLTSDKFGAGWTSATDFSLLEEYCEEAGLKISPAYTSQAPMSGLLTMLARIGNSAIVWSDNILKIIPYTDETVGSYVPDLTVRYDLTYDDFIADPETAPVKINRKRQADAYNAVKVE